MRLSHTEFLASQTAGGAGAETGTARTDGGGANGSDHCCNCVNPTQFGAKGTGAVDDAPAVLDALKAVGKSGQYGTPQGEGLPVCMGPGVYRLDSPLDLTGSQFNLIGAGAYQTVLRGNTGGVVLDMSVSGFSTVRTLLVDTLDMTSPSTVGILQARSKPTDSVPHNDLYDTVVRLDHDPEANGGNGTVALYNVGAETTTYHSVMLRADVGLYLGSGNGYKLTSPYIGKIGDNVSMTVVAMEGTSEIFALSGPAVRINGAAQIDLGDTALASVGATTYDYAIEILAQVSGLRYSGSVEGFPGLLWAPANLPLTGLFLECYMAHQAGKHHIFLNQGASLIGGRIDVVPNPGTWGGNLIVAETGSGTTVEAMDINLYEQGIDLGENGKLFGCAIRSTRTLAETKAGIIAQVKAGNVITATDGVHIDGVTPW